MSTYLRVEAQNLTATLFDTDQMSVIRGGSLILRDAILGAATVLGQGGATAVRVGAEAAVFRLAPTGTSIEDLVQQLRKQLAVAAPEFTFAVVKAQAESDSEGIDKTAAVARWKQGRSLRLVPEKPGATGTREVCPLTRVRPAPEAVLHGKHRFLSLSAKRRIESGRDLRQSFYQQEADPGVARGLQFASHLEDLSTGGPFPSIDGKIAILSMDGNSFGQAAARLSGAEAAKFDEHLRHLRRALLTRVLNFLAEPAVHANERKHGEHLRLETLLWAGDEFQLIVPAWLGVPLLQAVFDEIKTWRTSPGKAGTPLTVSAGLLLCSHKMPIHRALGLAGELQLRAKAAAKTGPNAPRNAWDYLVLESLDFSAAMNLDEFWKRRLGTAAAPRALLPCTNYTVGLKALEEALRNSDSRRKVYASAQLIAEPQASHARETNEWQKTPEASQVRTAMRALLPVAQTEAEDVPWLHLRELWDYLLPRPRKSATPGDPA